MVHKKKKTQLVFFLIKKQVHKDRWKNERWKSKEKEKKLCVKEIMHVTMGESLWAP
jgi:hypothetical protein